MTKTRWRDMSDRQRALVVAGVVAETALKALALMDLKNRPAAEVRGPKWAWAVGLATVSSFGALPAAYFVVGRRQSPTARPTS
jgi:hypothetical protein